MMISCGQMGVLALASKAPEAFESFNFDSPPRLAEISRQESALFSEDNFEGIIGPKRGDSRVAWGN